MGNIEKSKEKLLQELQELRKENDILKSKYYSLIHKQVIAEELLNNESGENSYYSESDTLKHIQELQVHQVELEAQNEELKKAKEKAERAEEKFTRLYDLSPSGYFTLSKYGIIIELNLCGSQMFGKERSLLKNSSFDLFISEDSKPVFNKFLAEIFKSRVTETCEISLYTNDGFPIYKYLTGIITEHRDQCLVTVTDITEHKQAGILLKRNEELVIAKEKIELTEKITKAFSIELAKSKEKAERINEQMSALLKAMPDIILIQNREGIFIDYHAHQSVKLFVPPELFLGKSYFDVLPSEIAIEFKPIFELAFETRQVQSFDYSLIMPNGTKYFEARLIAYDDDKILSIIRDITDRKLAEEALKKSQIMLSETEKIGKVGGWEINIATGKQSWTEEIYKIHEVDFNFEPTVENGINFYTNESKSIIELAIKNAVELGEPFDLELEIITDKGNFRNVHAIGKTDLVNNRIYGFFQDNTDQKKSEETIKNAWFYTRSLIEASIDSLVTISADGKITDVNQATEKITGVPRNILIGSDFLDYFTEPDKAVDGYLQVFTHDIVRDYPLTIRHSSGQTTDVLYNASIYKNDFGEVQGVFAVARDITDRKKAEAEIQQKNLELIELNSSKDKFFSIIAHDLRSPFSGFLGLTKLMSENIHDFSLQELQRICNTMQTSANNLYQLLENLLQWSRIQRGLIDFNPEFCKLYLIVEKNIDIIYEFAKQKEIEIINKISQEIFVTTDLPMLNTILRNLISNAVKFTPRCGKIEIGTLAQSSEGLKTSEGFIQIYVKDNGIGMGQDILENLFKLDQDVSRRGTEKEPSTGLGLILCKEFIEKNAGNILVKSEENKGSTFYFTLPSQRIN